MTLLLVVLFKYICFRWDRMKLIINKTFSISNILSFQILIKQSRKYHLFKLNLKLVIYFFYTLYFIIKSWHLLWKICLFVTDDVKSFLYVNDFLFVSSIDACKHLSFVYGSMNPCIEMTIFRCATIRRNDSLRNTHGLSINPNSVMADVKLHQSF